MTDSALPSHSSHPSPTNLDSLTRRRFLQVSTAAVTVGLTRPTFAKEPSLSQVTVGAHPWVYAATQPNYDISPILGSIFADMKYAGMDGIELMHTALRPDDAVRRIRQFVQQHELPVIGTSFGGPMWNRSKREEVLEEAKLVISRLAEVGGTTLGTSVGSAGHKKTEDELDTQAQLLRQIISFAEDHKVEVNLHNHTYEVENNLHDLRGTLARIPDVKLGPDLDWLVQGDVDPVEFIVEYGKQIVFLHLRDQKSDKTWVEAMGEGDMDYSAVAVALKKVGFSGHAVIELAHPRDLKLTRPLRESLKQSRKYVHDVLGF
jgi:sugar phosphate isomerase/epimerase